MTHTLHRRGNIKDLKEDYVILAMLAAGVNDKYYDSRKKLIKIAEILNENNPVNIMPEIGWNTSSTITAAYKDIETVKRIIQILKKEDFGISIVISGLVSEIENVLKEVNLEIDTVHFSLNFHGNRKDLLPPEEILEVTTMCGHHCISPQSITYYVELIKKGKISLEKASVKLTKPCVCGIFNPLRAKNILNSLVNK